MKIINKLTQVLPIHVSKNNIVPDIVKFSFKIKIIIGWIQYISSDNRLHIFEFSFILSDGCSIKYSKTKNTIGYIQIDNVVLYAKLSLTTLISSTIVSIATNNNNFPENLCLLIPFCITHFTI